MERFCRICLKQADVTCTCEKNLFLCFEHFATHFETSEGQHKLINLKVLRDEFYKKCNFNLEKINKAKSNLICRSNYMIEVILWITKTQLSAISKNYDSIKNILKNKDFSDEFLQMVDEYGNVKIKEYELDDFNEIAKNYLSVLINESEFLSSALNPRIIKDKNSKLKEKSKNFKDLKVKIERFKLELNKKNQKLDEEEKESNKRITIIKSHNLSSIVKKLERDYKLFLEGHTSSIASIASTSDSKYIISGSSDKTIRIWNLLEKRQETVLEGHTSSITGITITSDNKYIISSSMIKQLESEISWRKDKKQF